MTRRITHLLTTSLLTVAVACLVYGSPPSAGNEPYTPSKGEWLAINLQVHARPPAKGLVLHCFWAEDRVLVSVKVDEGEGATFEEGEAYAKSVASLTQPLSTLLGLGTEWPRAETDVARVSHEPPAPAETR